MQPPAVQNLSDIISGLNSVYDPQRQAVQGQIDTTNTNATQAEAGINASKDAAFNGITNTANSRGVLFSGFTPDAQAKYTASTYLPSLVKLHQSANDNISKLQQAIIQLNSTQQNEAQKTQAGQKTDLNNFNIAQTQAALKQQEMQQALDIANANNATKLQAAGISASARAGANPTPAEVKLQALQHIAGQLASNTGSATHVNNDNYVSNETWGNALNDFNANGGSTREFFQKFSQFVNPKYKTSYPGWALR